MKTLAVLCRLIALIFIDMPMSMLGFLIAHIVNGFMWGFKREQGRIAELVIQAKAQEDDEKP